MNATARPATRDDIPELVTLYAHLEVELTALKEVWAITDGLEAPVDEAFAALIGGQTSTGVLVGELGDVPLGFLVWHHRDLLPQADGERIAAIDLVFTDPEARRVGIGEVMLLAFIEIAEEAGIARFDAVAPPGHRDAKNFFESHGFKARRIVMHRDGR